MRTKQQSFFDGEHPFKIDKPIRLIELFAGIGAQSKALERLQAQGRCKFEHYRICEFDKYAVQSYNAVHGTNFQTSDITQLHASDLGIVDREKYCYIMTYSFPCTDLSVAGKQAGMSKGSGTRSGLLWEVERLLDECNDNLPQVLVMENVPQVFGTKNMADFADWLAKLDSLGYHSEWEIINATEFGVPQNRQRCFMVSVLGNYFYAFPQGSKLERRLSDVLEPSVDEKYYLSAKALENIQTNLCDKDISSSVRGGGRGSLDRHSWDIVVEPSQKDRANDRNSDHDIVEPTQELLFPPNPTEGTVCEIDGKAYIFLNGVWCRIRKLTPRECWRLMDFTDADFDNAKAAGLSNSQLYKQAGNSIVVACLEAIFGEMC